ncbi:hypothetical protein [Actinoplanes xinjiangensis]|uniref:hypothetical protein n=1 Tax=Actinoplanes xinjiangensis TaxID=512350 RepID=UPI0034470518
MTNNTHTNPAPRTTEGTGQEQQYYAYFISVMDTARQGLRTTQIQLFLTQAITTLDDVFDVQEYIRTNNPGLENAAVLGFTLLRMVPASEVRGR